MKHLIISVCFCVVTTVAQAQERLSAPDYIKSLTKTAAMFSVIGGDCVKFYAIDDAVTSRAVQGALKSGFEAVGKEKFKILLYSEMTNYGKEVGKIGLKRWCDDKKAFLESRGVKAFID